VILGLIMLLPYDSFFGSDILLNDQISDVVFNLYELAKVGVVHQHVVVLWHPIAQRIHEFY
jgi:hypothetical protein